MSTSSAIRDHEAGVHADHVLLGAALATGVAFAAEALVSVVIDAHVGYHSLNAVLNLALLVACADLARRGRPVVGRAGVVGGWATAVMALLAAVGGLYVVLVETLSSSESSGAVDGVSHTAVLASILFMIPLGIGLRRLDGVSGLLVAASSASMVVMVLAGLDQPELFLVPEVALGVGWILLSRAVLAGSLRR